MCDCSRVGVVVGMGLLSLMVALSCPYSCRFREFFVSGEIGVIVLGCRHPVDINNQTAPRLHRGGVIMAMIAMLRARKI